MTAIPHPVHASAFGAHAHDGAHGYPELSFVKKYIFSIDHKMIGLQFLFLGLMFFVFGGLLALVVRWQLAWPDASMPGFHPVPVLAKYMKWSNGQMPQDFYTSAFTM